MYSVIYVEDNAVNSVLMEAIVGLRPNIDLRCLADGRSAIAAAMDEPPDLFLLDMHLADMTGVELLARLRSHPVLCEVPAVVVSADAGAGDVAVARAHGFCDYWIKPLDVERVLSRLDELLKPA
jgi:CheY-like chemotaxis protein